MFWPLSGYESLDAAVRRMTGRVESTWRRINIVQGQQHVDDDPDLILTTILGSCVAACIWDPVLGLGGMNHFLLPGEMSRNGEIGTGGFAVRYGVHAMEMLVNGLLHGGAQRNRLQAKLFGGARMTRGLTDVGAMNAKFAEDFLAIEKIALVGGSLRGEHGRRLQFWPTSGRARQILIGQQSNDVFHVERASQIPTHDTDAGSVDFF